MVIGEYVWREGSTQNMFGTSACKVVAFDLRGEVIAEATTEHRIRYPKNG